jgi:drug/metabolite transporter (DMT)-like permease
MFAIAIIFTLLPLIFLISAVSLTTPTNILILQNFYLVIIVLIQRFIYKKEIKRITKIGVSFNILGILLIMWPISQLNPNFLGDLLVLVATVFMAFMAIIQDKIIKKSKGIYFHFTNHWIPMIALFFIVLFQGNLGIIRSIDSIQIFYLLFLGIGVSGFAYLLSALTFEDKNMTPEIFGIFFPLTPIIGVLIGVFFFGELLNVLNIIGISLVIISIYLTNIPKKENKEIEMNEENKKNEELTL